MNIYPYDLKYRFYKCALLLFMAFLKIFDDIQHKEYYDRFDAAKYNKAYTVTYTHREEDVYSRLRNQSPSTKKSPIQQAVQDSYITMEELQKDKTRELQERQQPKNLTSDEYSNLPEIFNNDDFARQVAEAESENNKWKKQK